MIVQEPIITKPSNAKQGLRFGIVTPLDTTRHGGLESYVRVLRETLQTQQRGGVERVVCHDRGGPLLQGRATIDGLLPLMTRPRLRSFARWYAERAGDAAAMEQVAGCDIVHYVGTGWNLMGFPLERAARRQGIPITCWPAVHPGTWGDAPLDIDLYQRMDAVFVQSDYEADHLVKLGVERSRLVRCGCAAPDDTPGDGGRFRAKHELRDELLVLFVGRKSRAKGYHALREAVSNLVADSIDVKLISIGRDCEPPYPSLPAEVDIDLGAADDATKHDALAACDVFALPSEAESFGIVYLEAWAYGKPVVCGTAPASRELVTRHGGGVVSDGSTPDIACRLAQLLDSRDMRGDLGTAGRCAVDEHYTTGRVVDTHVATWDRLRGGHE